LAFSHLFYTSIPLVCFIHPDSVASLVYLPNILHLKMLWEDNNGVLRCVTHGGGWGDPFGFAYWSTDGG
jgi:hypothetical protein